MKHPAWQDGEMLEALEMQADGCTVQQIADRFGKTRNSAVGMLHRIDFEERREVDACVKPENCDGGMPARWWVDGLRGRVA